MIRPTRTLAIDPTGKGFAYVLLEGRELLLDWGLAQAKHSRVNGICRRVTRLIERTRPDLLVVEEPQGSRRGSRAQGVIRTIAALGDRENVAWCMVTRAQIRRAFGRPESKYEIARAIVELFPELSHRLPPKRRAWMSEDERMGLFDAASFALTVLSGLEETV